MMVADLKVPFFIAAILISSSSLQLFVPACVEHRVAVRGMAAAILSLLFIIIIIIDVD